MLSTRAKETLPACIHGIDMCLQYETGFCLFQLKPQRRIPSATSVCQKRPKMTPGLFLYPVAWQILTIADHESVTSPDCLQHCIDLSSVAAYLGKAGNICQSNRPPLHTRGLTSDVDFGMHLIRLCLSRKLEENGFEELGNAVAMKRQSVPMPIRMS